MTRSFAARTPTPRAGAALGGTDASAGGDAILCGADANPKGGAALGGADASAGGDAILCGADANPEGGAAFGGADAEGDAILCAADADPESSAAFGGADAEGGDTCELAKVGTAAGLFTPPATCGAAAPAVSARDAGRGMRTHLAAGDGTTRGPAVGRQEASQTDAAGRGDAGQGFAAADLMAAIVTLRHVALRRRRRAHPAAISADG